MGWPATIVLLVVSYLYGTWRLRNLSGPSTKSSNKAPSRRGQASSEVFDITLWLLAWALTPTLWLLLVVLSPLALASGVLRVSSNSALTKDDG
jgi:hypothetical protein